MLDFLTLQTATGNSSIMSIIYTVLLSFALSSLVALTYEKTFRGLSYSRNYIQALILSAVVAGSLMQAIGENPMRGLGILGALAIIRFRTNFKDPRDIIFLFAAVASGISCGVFGYAIAVIGTIGFCAVAFLLYYSPFGQARSFDGMLRFNVESDSATRLSLESILKDFCANVALISIRETAQGTRLDYAYHVKIKKDKIKEEFINQIRNLKSVRDVNLLLQETTVEL
jgi:uncharacterized membrane protein YhiD involved in acid resistance